MKNYAISYWNKYKIDSQRTSGNVLLADYNEIWGKKKKKGETYFIYDDIEPN